jgi:hypothetical protein
VGITAPARLADDLADAAAILAPGGCQVFSPGDICPGNKLVTASGIRFADPRHELSAGPLRRQGRADA